MMYSLSPGCADQVVFDLLGPGGALLLHPTICCRAWQAGRRPRRWYWSAPGCCRAGQALARVPCRMAIALVFRQLFVFGVQVAVEDPALAANEQLLLQRHSTFGLVVLDDLRLHGLGDHQQEDRAETTADHVREGTNSAGARDARAQWERMMFTSWSASMLAEMSSRIAISCVHPG